MGSLKFAIPVLVCVAAMAGAPRVVAQTDTPALYMQTPAWGPLDRTIDQQAANACAGPGAKVIGLPGRALYRGERGQIRAVTVSASSLVALAKSDPEEALIFSQGVDAAPLRRPLEGSIVIDLGGSADGRFLSWRSGDGVSVLDISTGRLAPILGQDCDARAEQWMGHDLVLDCGAPKAGTAILTPDGEALRQTRFFPIGGADVAVATIDASGTRLVRGAKLYAGLDAATADGAIPQVVGVPDDRAYRAGDRLLQATEDDPPSAPEGYVAPPTLVLRDADTGQTLKTRVFTDATCRPSAIATAPDGRAFALLLEGDLVEMIDAHDLSIRAIYSLRRSRGMPASGLAVLPDGRVVSWSDMDVAVHDPRRPG
jgi:hypothetical protein